MRELKKFGESVVRGISNLLARASLAAPAKQGKLQSLQLQVLSGEAKEAVELFEPYGYTGVAMEGAESVVAFIGGSRTHAIALVQTDRRFRPTDLLPGEVALFTNEGTRIVLRRDGKVEVIAAAEVRITTAKVIVEGNLDVVGNTTFTGTVMANGKVIDERSRHGLPGGGQTLEVV